MLDGLAKALQTRINLCVPLAEHLVANCCIHALQLQLQNLVVAVFGEGGLGKINVMQMPHSVCDPQEAIAPEEWRHMLWKSSQFVAAFDASSVVYDQAAIDGMSVSDRNFNTFCQSHVKVLAFHSKFKRGAPVDPETLNKLKGTVYSKMIAPVLTRWWTVGTGCLYAFDCCLVFCHVCQSVINSYTSEAKVNRIASGLHSFVSDVVNFIDMTLIQCFNHACTHPHLRWFQECTECTNKCGFQSHNILVRHCLMERQLHSLIGAPMNDHHEAIWNYDPDGLHFKKLELFFTASNESLQKHFMRWVSPKTLSAALLSESPTAVVVAAVTSKGNFPSAETFGSAAEHDVPNQRLVFELQAHKCRINLSNFDKFLCKRVGNDQTCSPLACTAADKLLRGLDLQSKDCIEGSKQCPLRLRFHHKHGALPSQTQFTESGVKDAKNVLSADRSEQVRTCMSVMQSATPLTKTKEDANTNKIRAIIVSTVERINPHIRESNDEGHKQNSSVWRL